MEDIDKDIFVRFVRWTYSKDYPAREHKVAPPTPEPPPTDEFDGWGSFGSSKKKKKKKTDPDKGSSKEAFVSKEYDLGDNWNANPAPAPRSNKSPTEDYSDVFLCHTKLYVFAEKYDIKPLQILALKKLKETLAIYTLYQERVGDILGLLKYVYANTGETKSDSDDIRAMLAHYVGCEMEILLKEGEIKELLSDNEEMLGDFLNMFVSRLS